MHTTMFIREVAKKSGFTQGDVKKVTKAVFDTIGEIVASGESYNQPGFGKFYTVDVDARDCRNPKTGEAVHVEAKKKVKFKPSGILKDIVNA